MTEQTDQEKPLSNDEKPDKGEPQDKQDPVYPTIKIQDFQKLSLRVGVIVEAEDHPNADRLLVLKVDIGESVPRQVVAGIKQSYAASEMTGKRVVVVSNLKPAMLRGVESQGMVLAASDESAISLLSPEKPLAAGCIVR